MANTVSVPTTGCDFEGYASCQNVFKRAVLAVLPKRSVEIQGNYYKELVGYATFRGKHYITSRTPLVTSEEFARLLMDVFSEVLEEGSEELEAIKEELATWR